MLVCCTKWAEQWQQVCSHPTTVPSTHGVHSSGPQPVPLFTGVAIACQQTHASSNSPCQEAAYGAVYACCAACGWCATQLAATTSLQPDSPLPSWIPWAVNCLPCMRHSCCSCLVPLCPADHEERRGCAHDQRGGPRAIRQGRPLHGAALLLLPVIGLASQTLCHAYPWFTVKEGVHLPPSVTPAHTSGPVHLRC
jgi:hypothetical protein